MPSRTTTRPSSSTRTTPPPTTIAASPTTQGQHDRAIQDYDQAIKLDPSDAIVYNNRGIAYSTKGQHDRAIQDYDQAIKLNPSDATAFNNRGLAYSAKGQLDRAIQDYDQAIKLDPSDAIVYYNRGIAYSAKGQHDRAIQDYDQAIKLDPSRTPIAYNNRGNAYSTKGQLDRAIQDYDQAIKLNPSDADIFYARSLARAKKGDKKGANADLAAARRTGIPAQAQQPQDLGAAWAWCGASEAAGVPPDLRISGCTTVIELGKTPSRSLSRAYTNRGNAYRAQGQPDHAIEDYNQALTFVAYIAYNNRGDTTVEQLLRGVVPDPKSHLDRTAQNAATAFIYFYRGVRLQ